MSKKLSQSAFVIMLGDRFYSRIEKKRVMTAWCLEGSTLFSPNSHLFGEKSPRNMEFIKSQLDAKGKKYKIVPVKLQLPENENVNRLDLLPKAESQPDLFVCKGCNHQLPNEFVMRTKEWCYMCDPNVTLEELLADEPVTEKKPTYLFPTDILIKKYNDFRRQTIPRDFGEIWRRMQRDVQRLCVSGRVRRK